MYMPLELFCVFFLNLSYEFSFLRTIMVAQFATSTHRQNKRKPWGETEWDALTNNNNMKSNNRNICKNIRQYPTESEEMHLKHFSWDENPKSERNEGETIEKRIKTNIHRTRSYHSSLVSTTVRQDSRNKFFCLWTKVFFSFEMLVFCAFRTIAKNIFFKFFEILHSLRSELPLRPPLLEYQSIEKNSR